MQKKDYHSPTSLKLKDVLPVDQKEDLSEKVLNMTGKDIEAAAKAGNKVDKDIWKELVKLAVKRVNQGQPLFPYSSMEFEVPEDHPGDPQW